MKVSASGGITTGMNEMSNDSVENFMTNSIKSIEYGFIIECGDEKASRYLCVNQVDPRIFWVSDAFDAIRFSRKVDAETFLSLVPITDVEVRVINVAEYNFGVETPMSSPIMKYFEYSHLPAHLQEVSKPLGDLGKVMDDFLPDCAEKSVGLRKLLEAKDCFVRARLSKP